MCVCVCVRAFEIAKQKDFLQLFPLRSKEAAREAVSHLCLWLLLCVFVKCAIFLDWISAVWIPTTSPLSCTLGASCPLSTETII